MRKFIRLVALAAFFITGHGALVLVDMSLLQEQSASRFQTTEPPVPVWTYDIVNTYPHDPSAYTQGLIYHDGVLIESTGLYGQSSLRRVELRTGKILKRIPVSGEYFAEGITLFKGRIFQLTWVEGKGFIYDPASFRVVGEFAYEGEGWGLTNDGRALIMSNGTSEIRFINPDSFKTEKTISVNLNGRPVPMINELEYIKGEIYANIWQADLIIRIEPKTGRVLGLIDMTGLLSENSADPANDVLNGIAYDEKEDRIFVTGKRWPKLFQIRLKEKSRHAASGLK